MSRPMAFWNSFNRAVNRLFYRDALMEESRRQVIKILERNGFAQSETPEGLLNPYLPWRFPEPELIHFYSRGVIHGADVEICEYEQYLHNADDTDEKGNVKIHLLAIVKHPRIRGKVHISPDLPEWDSGLKFITNLPPVLALRAVSWGIGKLTGMEIKDHPIGNPLLDRLYIINALDEDTAKEALTPALQEFLLSLPFQWTISLREGLMLVSVNGARMTLSDIGRLMEPLPRLIAAVLPSGQAFR